MKEISISQFKAKCLALLEEVRLTKEPIRVTRFGRPVAEIVPPKSAQRRGAWIGSMKHSMKIIGDIISPANEKSEWESSTDPGKSLKRDS